MSLGQVSAVIAVSTDCGVQEGVLSTEFILFQTVLSILPRNIPHSMGNFFRKILYAVANIDMVTL
jgi:hypothetical protein